MARIDASAPGPAATARALATRVFGRKGPDRSGSADARGLVPQGADGQLRSALEALGHAILRFDGERLQVIAGEGAIDACADILGMRGEGPGAVTDALTEQDPQLAEAMHSLHRDGVPFERIVMGRGGAVTVRGLTSGALALLELTASRAPAPGPGAGPADLAELRGFLEAQGDPMFIVDREGHVLVANRAWLDAVDIKDLDEARRLGPAADRPGLELAVQADAAGEPRERVWWLSSAGGRRALRTRATPLGGGLTAVCSRDETVMQSAAESRARQEAAFGRILDQINDAVAIFGPDQRLRTHNPAFAQLWDLEPAWLADRPPHGSLLDRLRQAGRLPELVDYGRFRAEELARYERLEPSPEAVWRIAGERLLRVRDLPYPDGGLVLVFSDITSEVRLKSQFNHLIQVQQATLDKLTDAVAVFGADARLKLSNDSFSRLWGLPASVLSSAPAFDDIVERCVVRLHDMHFWRDLKGRITDPDPGVRAALQGEVTADGRILSWQSRPLPDGATLVSFADVTDTRRLEGALADRQLALDAAEQLKRDFISSVSYELRTPLTTILGYAELLQTAEKGLSGQGRGWLSAVRSAAADLARSVEDILTFAEIDAGELSLNKGPTDVQALLEQTESRWRDRAADLGVTLELDTGGAGGSLDADGQALGRALDHLLDRALRQTPAGGWVRLTARRTQGEVCLEVSDNGRGVPFHIQARIFDRFSGEEGSGAGLGMALVKAIVELHGGWVALESEPGAGATFACHIPDGAPGEGGVPLG